MSGTTKKFDGGLPLTGQAAVCVGIDQSYTGFGLTAMDPEGNYYTWVYKSKDKGVVRLIDIEAWIDDRFLELGYENVTDVAIEAPVRMSHSALMSGELLAIVKMACYTVLGGEARTPIQVPPSTLKKYVTGKGRAEKSQMLLEVYKRWDASFTDDNAADSYGLARIANKFADTVVQQDVLDTVADPKFRDAL